MPQGDFIFEKSSSSKSACRDSFIISWEVEGEQTLCTKLFGCKFMEIIFICTFQANKKSIGNECYFSIIRNFYSF